LVTSLHTSGRTVQYALPISYHGPPYKASRPLWRASRLNWVQRPLFCKQTRLKKRGLRPRGNVLFSFLCSVLPGLLLNCLVTNHSSTITSHTIARISEAVLVQAERSHPIGIKYILLSGLASLAPNFKTSSSRVCPSSSSSSCPFDLDNTNTLPTPSLQCLRHLLPSQHASFCSSKLVHFLPSRLPQTCLPLVVSKSSRRSRPSARNANSPSSPLRTTINTRSTAVAISPAKSAPKILRVTKLASSTTTS
jgi:hypothetical protein